MSEARENGVTTLRLGARGSLLSRRQSEGVARELEAAVPGLKVEMVVVATSGDRIQDKPLHEFGGKGLFTKELELAILRGEVDLAVHSYKDVPVTMPLVDAGGKELVIAAVPVREDARDVLACAGARTIGELPAGARVGTGSLRRGAQILALRPDVVVLPIRGNVDTRIRKLKAGEFEAVILAYAGVKRAGLFEAALMTPIPEEEMLPAAGQGALALQCRRDAAGVRAALEKLHDPVTALEVRMEREVVRLLNGDCHSPIAVRARAGDAGGITIRAAVAAREGRPPVIRAQAAGAEDGVDEVVKAVVEALVAQGARELLAGSA